MASANRKIRRLAEREHPFDGLIEPCPRCGAKTGDRCMRPYGGKMVYSGGPHAERVELIERLRNLGT